MAIDEQKLEKAIAALQKGDSNALGDIYVLTSKGIFTFVLPILHDYQIAEDVMQQTYISCYDNIQSYRLGTSARNWLLTIAKNAAALCRNFGIDTTDEPYLLVDPTGSARAGMLLSSSGVHLADGRGGTLAITWKDLPGITLACQRGMIVIGQSGVTTSDAQAMTTLLQQIQAKFAQ